LYVKTRSLPALVICAYDLAWFAGIIILSARREFTIAVMLDIMLSAWFARRWIVPRWAAGAGVSLVTLAVTSIGTWRALTDDPYGSAERHLPTWEEFTNVDWVGNFFKIASEGGERATELRNAIYDVTAAQMIGSYDLGASYWNYLVFRYVPAQFLGAEFKSSLMFDVQDVAAWAFMHVPHPGSTHTGVSDSFMSFWFLGPLVFFLIARIMCKLYRAGMEGHMMAQFFYMFLISNALQTVTHSTAGFFAQLIHVLIFTLPLAWARIPNRRKFSVRNLPRHPRIVR
jgi:hypothetical protein